MQNLSYSVYNMRSRFSKMPGQPKHCPLCGGKLSETSVGPSRSIQDDLQVDCLITVHNFSLLFICENCRWWCIRESWDYCEISSELDFLVVGTPCTNEQISEEPWLAILDDPDLYLSSHTKKLPADLVAIFK